MVQYPLLLLHTQIARTKCSFITMASISASVKLSLILEVISKGKQLCNQVVH